LVEEITMEPCVDVRAAIAHLAPGGIVVVVGDDGGDLVLAAEHATPRSMAFIVRHTSGFVCVALTDERADALGLPRMVRDDARPAAPDFTVSVDAAAGIGTGISASDRARTARVLADPAARASDLTRPGHVMGSRARPGGVLERPGRTEAAVDLCRLAGLAPVAVRCELVDTDGSLARRGRVLSFAREHRLPVVTVAALADHRRSQETVQHVAAARMPLEAGSFTAHGYRAADGTEHLALVAGDPAVDQAAIVRVHEECLTGDVLGSRRCDCGPRLRASLDEIGAAGCGVLVYLRGRPGHGTGPAATLATYASQDHGGTDARPHGVPADAGRHAVAASILADLGVRAVATTGVEGTGTISYLPTRRGHAERDADCLPDYPLTRRA
jgi:3,4-dihydroxy 2-butanone 4-phosphate synthase/GTP cyclohydrolase II